MFLQQLARDGQYGQVIAIVVVIVTIAILALILARKEYLRRKAARCREENERIAADSLGPESIHPDTGFDFTKFTEPDPDLDFIKLTKQI
jgi:hypothetical protein